MNWEREIIPFPIPLSQKIISYYIFIFDLCLDSFDLSQSSYSGRFALTYWGFSIDSTFIPVHDRATKFNMIASIAIAGIKQHIMIWLLSSNIACNLVTCLCCLFPLMFAFQSHIYITTKFFGLPPVFHLKKKNYYWDSIDRPRNNSGNREIKGFGKFHW